MIQRRREAREDSDVGNCIISQTSYEFLFGGDETDFNNGGERL